MTDRLSPTPGDDAGLPALDQFTPQVRDWFTATFAAPTPAQVQAWPAIGTGQHVLISAPTGSGKTLAAFLWALDRFIAEPPPDDPRKRRMRLVYISPLKALGYDVQKNLRAPLRGIGADVRVATRTGDTPQSERREMLRHPPDVLITTPESLYIMLTSQARRLFTGIEWVIVDEIHAVAQTKRGAHLAVTLERLAQAAGRDVQRIGLSATQNPLEEVARFLVGPTRRCTVVDVGLRKPLDLRIHVPVESMVHPGAPPMDLDQSTGKEPTRRSIWPAIYPELLQLVREHRSTLVFVNNRRTAERLALRLNELAGEPVARAHHGSLAREERLLVEDLLKSGKLPCLVATSSLELGIDMGALDLVVQVESPKSVTRGLQRIGRAGHGVGDVSKGRIFPKFRADLLECAVVARRMREGLIETTVVPRNPLDVLAQQVVAMAVTGGDGGVAVDDVLALVRRTHTYAELERRQLENVLDMLDGRYPSAAFGELRARIVWDRVAGKVTPRSGARGLAVTNAGTIPDRGLFSVNLPDGRRVGELDEEMVYEARTGQTFLLGATSWRIEEITRDRVVVTPAPGASAAVPFWHGEGVGRPKELGEAIGAFSRWAVDQDEATLQREYDLDERAARNLLAFLREQQNATRVLPSDRTVVVERFRDEIGDWRLCVLSPLGGRVHSAWALALRARLRTLRGVETEAIWSDDGIIVHLPDADEPPRAELALIDPDEVEDLIIAELGDSTLFGARFRENAARALLIPRARPGRRTPLWQQRLKAQSLLEVARGYGEFPIVLETYRECLQDVLDVAGLRDLLRKLQTREIALVEAETAVASPFAGSLLFDYIATYMYEGDTPSAERRAAALALDRELLAELLGQEELRELIDPGALAQVESDLQHRSPHLLARSRDEVHDLLRRLGDLSLEEVRERVTEPELADEWLQTLGGNRRAVEVQLGGEQRWIAAEDAGLYRDALGAAPRDGWSPAGLPEPFLADVPEAMLRLVERRARTSGPFESHALKRRYGLDLAPVLQALELAGELVRGELRPGGSSREWCDPEVLRRLRRASLAALRKEIEPVEQSALARFAPGWQGIDRQVPAGAGSERLREVLAPLQGLALTPEVWEHDVLPRRLGAYSPAWLDALCASGEVVWVGAGTLGRRGGRVTLYFREDAALLGPPAGAASPAAGDAHEAVRERLRRGASFFIDLLLDTGGYSAAALEEALWDLVWAGEATNDAFAPLRSPKRHLAAVSRQETARYGSALPSRVMRTGSGAVSPRGREAHGRRLGARRHGAPPQVQGRWSLTDTLFAGRAPGLDSRRAWAELLLDRYGVVTRELVLGEGIPGGFSALYDAFSALETVGAARRGYFIEGLGGAQFAVPGAVERLRAHRDEEPAAIVLAATDPAQPYGVALRWPQAPGRAPSRQPGAYVVLVGGEPALFVDRGGHALQVLAADPAGGRPGGDVTSAGVALAGAAAEREARLDTALRALVAAVQHGRVGRLALERIDSAPIVGTAFAARLLELGFRSGPRRFTLDQSRPS